MNLDKKIQLLKEQLYKKSLEHQDLSDQELITLSEEINKLIVEQYRLVKSDKE